VESRKQKLGGGRGRRTEWTERTDRIWGHGDRGGGKELATWELWEVWEICRGDSDRKGERRWQIVWRAEGLRAGARLGRLPRGAQESIANSQWPIAEGRKPLGNG